MRDFGGDVSLKQRLSGMNVETVKTSELTYSLRNPRTMRLDI